MNIEENVPIKTLTTMRLGGPTKYVAEIEELDDLFDIVDEAKEKNLPIWIMGDGANTIGHDEGFSGIIVRMKLRGISILYEDDDTLLLKGMAGEEWDDFVAIAVKKGFSGIEAMSKIPGTLGAAPVQNIGAYGQDIASVIENVEAYDRQTNEIVILTKDEMNMGYRNTRFNAGKDAGRFIVISVTVKLHKTNLIPPFYNSLQKYIDENNVTDFSPNKIREIVSELRAQKLPDPKKVASAGSFFKNIYLDKNEVKLAEEKEIPVWKNADGSGKINSGWLIEKCGLAGKVLHGFCVSDKAALVLINQSAESYDELKKARAEIINAVQEKFGYTLEQEPVEIVG